MDTHHYDILIMGMERVHLVHLKEKWVLGIVNFLLDELFCFLLRRSSKFFRSSEKLLSVFLSQLTLWSFEFEGNNFWRGHYLGSECKIFRPIEGWRRKKQFNGVEKCNRKLMTFLNLSKWGILKIFGFFFKEGFTTKGNYLAKTKDSDENQSVLRKSIKIDDWRVSFVPFIRPEKDTVRM